MSIHILCVMRDRMEQAWHVLLLYDALKWKTSLVQAQTICMSCLTQQSCKLKAPSMVRRKYKENTHKGLQRTEIKDIVGSSRTTCMSCLTQRKCKLTSLSIVGDW